MTQGRKEDPVTRFWAKVEKTDDCWNWTASLRYGYGQFGYAAGDIRPAHRVAWEWLVGPVPDGLHLDHLCRNRRCVNPDHLEPVTAGENVRRGEGFSGRNARKTHCDAGHVLEGDNLYLDPRGRRQCRACRRAAQIAFNARHPGYQTRYSREHRKVA